MNYPIPDQNDATQWAIYIALVQPVNSLDELLERLQKVVPAPNPYDYLNAAVERGPCAGRSPYRGSRCRVHDN